MSETIVIRTEAELHQAFQNALSSGAFSEILPVSPRLQTDAASDFDAVLELSLDGVQHRFGVEYKLGLGVRDLKVWPACSPNITPLLVTVILSESIVRRCRELQLSCLDLNGRIWLRGPGLLIDRSGGGLVKKGGSRVEYCLSQPEPDVFSLKSSRLARVLLSYPDRRWKQKDLAALTRLSGGLLSRLLNYMVTQGWVEGGRGDWGLVDRDALLDTWREADDWTRRGTLRQYSSLESDFERLARKLVESPGGDIAFTQWFAANLRFPYSETPVLSVYREEFPSDTELSKWNLRQVADGGKLWLIQPHDHGVFQAKRHVSGLPLVCDAQIYLDLLGVGLRGPDHAQALRAWEGFCKP